MRYHRVPVVLSLLTRLKNLCLNDNGLEGQIPRKLADLPLEFLYLHGNRFEGCTPRELKVLLERSFGYQWLGWVIPRFCESAEAQDDREVLEALFIATEGEPDEADKHSMISLHEDLLRRVPGLFSLINGPEEDFRKIWINGEYGVEQLELLLNADSSDMTVEQRTAQADIRRLIVFRDFVNKNRKVSGWRYRNNWMSDLPLSNWEGVTTDAEAQEASKNIIEELLGGLRNVGYKFVAETFTFTQHAFGVFTSPVDIVVKPGAVGTPITGSQLGEVALSCEEYD